MDIFFFLEMSILLFFIVLLLKLVVIKSVVCSVFSKVCNSTYFRTMHSTGLLQLLTTRLFSPNCFSVPLWEISS
jgi:hypothetical protein